MFLYHRRVVNASAVCVHFLCRYLSRTKPRQLLPRTWTVRFCRALTACSGFWFMTALFNQQVNCHIFMWCLLTMHISSFHEGIMHWHRTALMKEIKLIVDLYSASSRTRLRDRFLYIGTDLRETSSLAGHQLTLQNHAYGLVYHAMCLCTSPAFAGYSFLQRLPGARRRASSGWVELGVWFCAEVVYPPKDGHPSRH